MQDIYEGATIFVSIASYRDPELRSTIQSLLENAAFPERVHVGVLSQLRMPEDKGLIFGSCQGVTEQLVTDVDSQGAGWARAKILKEIYAGEDFVLQIDSHTRFDKAWDVKALEQFYSTGNSRCALSGYPTPYNAATGALQELQMSFFQCAEFNAWGLPVISSGAVNLDKVPVTPKPTAFIGAGGLFMPKKAIEEVGYDPHYVHTGEEIALAARLWTHGFDLFCFNRPFLWHNYGHETGRKIIWEDRPEIATQLSQGARRALALFGQEGDFTAEETKDLSIYRLGMTRSFYDYTRFAGLDFQTKAIRESTKKGDF